MLKAEWRTRYRWIPLVVLIAVITASSVTYFLIFPINHEMAAHISDPQQLSTAITKWVHYTWYRVILWSIEWVAMMYYFAARTLEAMDR